MGVLKRKARLGGLETIGLLGLFALVIYPLAFLVRESFLWNGSFSLEAYRQILSERSNYSALGRTLKVGVMVTLAATLTGTGIAWLCSRSDMGGHRRIAALAVFPFMVPPFIGAFSWGQLLGPVGYLNKVFFALTGLEKPFFNLYSEAGIVLVMAIHLYPLAFMTMTKAFDQMDGALEEAARVAGSGWHRVIRDVTLPVLMPAIANSALLIFVAAISNFGVPAALGFSNGYFVLTTRIFDAVMNFSHKNHFSIAAALSILLAGVAGIALFTANLALRQRRYGIVGGKATLPSRVPLDKFHGWTTALVWVFISFIAAAPLVAMALTAVTNVYGLPATPANWSLKHFAYVLGKMPAAQRALKNSFILSVSSASLAVIFSGILAYVAAKSASTKRSAIEFVATLPYAIPGTVLALSMILAFNKPIFGFRLYDTLGIILLAYVARYFIFPMRSVLASLDRVSGDLEEAARVSGAGQWRRFKDIVLPVIKPGIVLGWFLVLIPTMHELTVSVLLWSVGNETLGVAVFTLQESGGIQSTAALALVTIALTSILRWISGKIGGKEREL